MLEVIHIDKNTNLLKALYELSLRENSWHIRYPETEPIENRFFKYDIFASGKSNKEYLFGLASALLMQLDDSLENKLFNTRGIQYCGVSLKDSSLNDKKHIDHPRELNAIKVFGILNPDWDPENDGGEFVHGDTVVPMSFGTFCVFDPRVEHCANKIKTNKKRIAIDFGVTKL